MIIWLEKKLVLALHDRQVAEHGGTTGVRDEGLLESALARPQQLHAYGGAETDLADLAASLAYGLARNHPFVDGNKRTAAVTCEVFLELNGVRLEADDPDLFVRYLALAEGKLSAEEFASWLRAHIPPRSRDGVQEPRAAYQSRSRARRPTKAKGKARRKSAAAGK